MEAYFLSNYEIKWFYFLKLTYFIIITYKVKIVMTSLIFVIIITFCHNYYLVSHFAIILL